MTDTETMLGGYIECALWASLDITQADESGNNPPLEDRVSVSDVTGAVLEEMRADVEAFAEANAADLELYYERLNYTPAQAGYDFWLTREGHGAGFWDRYYGTDTELLAALKRLTEASDAYGSFDEIHNL